MENRPVSWEEEEIREEGGESERRKIDALSACSADAVYLRSIQPSVQLLRAFSKFWQSFQRLRH